MAKELRCGELVAGCSAVMEGNDENEVMSKAAEHARAEHGMTTIPSDIESKAKAAIRDK